MAMLQVELHPARHGKSRLLVDAEVPSFGVDSCGTEGRAQTVYFRTRQHTPDGLRIYSAAGQPWPRNETLGWAGPPGFVAESDYDRVNMRWSITVAGNGHAVEFTLTAFAVGTGAHHGPMARAARRIARAAYQHGRGGRSR